MSSVSSDPAKPFMPRRQLVMRRVMSPWKKGDSWLLLLIAERHDAEVDVQPEKVENACPVPLVVSMVDDSWRNESRWRNNYTYVANIFQNQADAFQLK